MKNTKQRSLLYIVLAAALGGFLFGFDSGVISGCEQAIQTEFGLSGFWHGLIVSGALIGTVIGVFTAGAPSDKWGRRPTLWLMGTLFLVSAVGCAFTVTNKAVGPHMLGWFRFIGGLAIGGVSVVVPLYIVEISPGRLRGRLVATNQLNIVFGILISYVSNYFVARWMAIDGGWFNGMCQWLAGVFSSNMSVEMVKWRVMLGMECLPIILFMALLLTIPESPRWLVRVGSKEEAEDVLTSVGYPDVPKTMVEIEESLREVAAGASARLFQKRYLKPILLAFFIAFFNQVSGINAINYYAPRIFDMIFGKGSEMASLAGTMGVGTVNLIFTVLAFFIIDKFGRRVMIIGGASLMILMHSLVAWQLSLGD
ncbi:MAG: MFS transporter, partial [Kiritimatiellae bacterium]|nr:MFS transporter [Kiritimatiellia bacterium]